MVVNCVITLKTCKKSKMCIMVAEIISMKKVEYFFTLQHQIVKGVHGNLPASYVSWNARPQPFQAY